MKPTATKLDVADVPRVARRAMASEITVVRAYAGARGKGLVRQRIAAAARELGLPPPPEPRAA